MRKHHLFAIEITSVLFNAEPKIAGLILFNVGLNSRNHNPFKMLNFTLTIGQLAMGFALLAYIIIFSFFKGRFKAFVAQLKRQKTLLLFKELNQQGFEDRCKSIRTRMRNLKIRSWIVLFVVLAGHVSILWLKYASDPIHISYAFIPFFFFMLVLGSVYWLKEEGSADLDPLPDVNAL